MKKILEHFNDLICGLLTFLYMYQYVIEETDGFCDEWYITLAYILIIAASLGSVRRHAVGIVRTIFNGIKLVVKKIVDITHK